MIDNTVICDRCKQKCAGTTYYTVDIYGNDINPLKGTKSFNTASQNAKTNISKAFDSERHYCESCRNEIQVFLIGQEGQRATNDIHKIANHFGFKSQSIMMIEEMAELTKALTKYKRYSEDGLQPIWNMRSAKICNNLVEEIADVEIMLEQIKYLLNITDEDTSEIKAEKIRRTLELIERGG
jgi:hypothetical protein